MTDTQAVTRSPSELRSGGDSTVTIDDLAGRMDQLGQQMNWLCENMSSLFAFVNQMGSSGGGLRGLMHMLRSTPDLNVSSVVDVPSDGSTNVVTNGSEGVPNV